MAASGASPALDGATPLNLGAFTRIAFQDLVALAKHDRQVFDELYYNREDELTQFTSILDDAVNTATNVVLMGAAGIGKSSFIHKLLGDSSKMDQLNVYPILIDYRIQVPSTVTGCYLHFIEEMERYFQLSNEPIHTLKMSREAHMEQNLRAINTHLEELPADPKRKHLLIVLDDFDYAEEDWWKLLDVFLPLAVSRKASVVFTVRPPLLKAVEIYDDRFTYFYARNSQIIPLALLNIPRVLLTRMALVLRTRDNGALYSALPAQAKKSSTRFAAALAEALGLQKLDSVKPFEYPFTNKHNTFMAQITNGNLREVFDIAADSLTYLFDPENDIELREEDLAERRVMGREGVLRVFMDDYPKKSTPFKIVNLNEVRSGDGNPIRYNVLELVKLRRVIDGEFFAVLKRLGHSREDVVRTIDYLSSKTHRMVSPERLDPPKGRRPNHDVPEFRINPKGEYYLQICKWEEYIQRCGTPKASVTEVL